MIAILPEEGQNLENFASDQFKRIRCLANMVEKHTLYNIVI